jgi:uncharacterized protein YhaN
MKTSILILATTALIFVMASCNSSAQKVENAQNEFVEAGKTLDKATEEYAADLESYRKITASKVNANNESILEFKERIKNEKQEAKDEYNKKIADLEKKNSDIQKKMDDYKADGKARWKS